VPARAAVGRLIHEDGLHTDPEMSGDGRMRAFVDGHTPGHRLQGAPLARAVGTRSLRLSLSIGRAASGCAIFCVEDPTRYRGTVIRGKDSYDRVLLGG